MRMDLQDVPRICGEESALREVLTNLNPDEVTSSITVSLPFLSLRTMGVISSLK